MTMQEGPELTPSHEHTDSTAVYETIFLENKNKKLAEEPLPMREMRERDHVEVCKRG